jgi:hypothetical protein
MSALLLYSPKCKFSREAVQFVNDNKSIQQIVKFHNIHLQGIPPQYKSKISSVPTLLTTNGKILVGGEVKNFLESLLPCEIENCSLGQCSFGGTDLEGDNNGDFFSLDNYGQSLQPAMTQQLQDKIKKNVNDAYDNLKF